MSIIAVSAIGIGLLSNPRTPPVAESSYKPAIMIDGEIYWLCPNGNVDIIFRDYNKIGKIEKISPASSKPDENFEAIGFEIGQEIYQSIDKRTIYVYRKEHNLYTPLVLAMTPAEQELYDLLNSGRRAFLKFSVQDVPPEEISRKIELNGLDYFIYEVDGKYYSESPYIFINRITEETYNKILELTTTGKLQTDNHFSQEVVDFVENNLMIIMSSPKESSNPMDYIKAHQKEYDDIIKHDNEEVHKYILTQFVEGATGLRGQLITEIGMQLLGQRNNVTDKTSSLMEWFMQINMKQRISLPHFSYAGEDPIKILVHNTEIEKSRPRRGDFTIIAPHIFASYEEYNKLKVFAATFISSYRLYGKVVVLYDGSIVPVAIAYVKNPDGSYTLEEYQQAMSGSSFSSSIEEFCTMPVTGKKIKGLADKILQNYSNSEDRNKLERENLIKHLKNNNQYGVFLYKEHSGELIPIT